MRQLPAWWLGGLAAPAAALVLVIFTGTLSTAESDLWTYRVIGWAIFWSTLAFTVAIGCVIVWIMKGPAYVADAYPPEGRETSHRGPRRD